MVIEAKYRSERSSIRIEGEKVEKLLEFARRARGGDAYIAVKFKGDEWRFLPITDGGGDVVVKPDDLGNAYTLEQLINKYMSKSLTEYLK